MTIKQYLLLYLVCLLVALVPSASVAKNSLPWHQIKPGIHYQQLNTHPLNPFAQIHVFKIDLKQAAIQFCQVNRPTRDLGAVAKADNATIVFNSGFFNKDKTLLGLRVNQGKILSPMKRISWWGIFSVRGNRAKVSPYRAYRYRRNIQFAVQAGPRLLVNGRIPKLKAGMAERTALGINRQGELLLVVTENNAMSTTKLAGLMRERLNATNALNLDGGGSTSLYAKSGDFEREVHGLTRIPDPICVS